MCMQIHIHVYSDVYIFRRIKARDIYLELKSKKLGFLEAFVLWS